MRVDQAGQERAAMPVEHPRREPGASARFLDSRHDAVAHPDVSERTPQPDPDAAEEKIVHAPSLPAPPVRVKREFGCWGRR
ncbi:hypothetical protein GCM10027360_32360 [Amycolatopsis echigonensis]